MKLSLSVCVLCLLVLTASQAQVVRRRTATPIKLSPTTSGHLGATTPFSLHLSAFAPSTEVAVVPQAGLLRITCAWDEADVPLEISITGAAGHGLPGRIGLTNQAGQSPVTIETKIEPEQVARGLIYIEIFPQMFPPTGRRTQKGLIHGTVSVAIVDHLPETFDEDEHRFRDIEDGKLLSVTEVASLETRLKSDPNDWSARLTLLSYYYSSADLKMARAHILAARRRHILWAIKNRPSAAQIFDLPELQLSNTGALADPVGANEAQNAWRHEITEHTPDEQALFNAASFCATIDPLFSETIIKREVASAPNSARWLVMLATLYATQVASGQDSTFAALARNALVSSNNPDVIGTAAVVLVEQVLSHAATGTPGRESTKNLINLAEQLAHKTSSLESRDLGPLLIVLAAEVQISGTREERVQAEGKVYRLLQGIDINASRSQNDAALLPIMANLAFDIKDDEAAMKYASKALELVSSQKQPASANGNGRAEIIHDSNDVLGRIALRAGDVQQAKDRLLKAADLPPGESFASNGPDMLLAQALIDQGERGTVAKYLEKLTDSWRRGHFLLQAWINDIRDGKSVRLSARPMLLQAPGGWYPPVSGPAGQK